MNISKLVGERLPEIKKLLFSETTEEAFVDAKLVDGTIIRYESLEIGAALSVVGEDGEIVAAPDGQHELESGEVVRTEEGVIVEVLEPEAEEVEEEAKDEEMSAEVPAFDADAFKLDIMNSVATLIQAEVEKFAKNDKVSDIEKAVSLMTDIVEKMAATPKEAPTKKVPNPFNKGTNYAEIAEKMRAAITKK
jgi:hypothetical protein